MRCYCRKPAQPSAKKCQQGIMKPSPLRTSASISPAPEYLVERQGLGFSCLSQVVAQSLHMGCSSFTLPETPCFEKHKAVEIPTWTETTSPPRTWACFTPTTNLDLALWCYPYGKTAPSSALPARRCLRPRRTAHSRRRRSLCRGRRQSQTPSAQCWDPPHQPHTLSWRVTPASTSIPEQSAHPPDRRHSSSTAGNQKPCSRR